MLHPIGQSVADERDMVAVFYDEIAGALSKIEQQQEQSSQNDFHRRNSTRWDLFVEFKGLDRWFANSLKAGHVRPQFAAHLASAARRAGTVAPHQYWVL